MDLSYLSAMFLKTLPIFLIFFNLNSCNVLHGGILYPRESESRQIQELNGMWNFRADRSACRCSGLEEKWYRQPLSRTGPVISMPVPSSYNDITTQKTLRDFVGWVWYDREMFVSPDWKNKRVVLRIDSAHYYSKVWMNGEPVMEHNGGHLPFEAVVNTHLLYGQPNIITIAVNNTLLPHTLPPGSLTFEHDRQRYPKGYFVQNLQFDFFNYAGIHRRVRLYTTPLTYVDDITIYTNIESNSGIVKYAVSVVGKYAAIKVDILDRNGTSMGSLQSLNGAIIVKKPVLWWPYTMNSEAGYLYTLKVTLTGTDGTMDVYRQPFGIRTVNVTATQILINEKPFYCHGAAKHEDSDIRGKGLDFALIARDFNMMKWLGINCFRTSHYPYAEEIMDEADKQGIVVIDECPGVGIIRKENFGNASLSHHLEVMEELVRRDKNRPSVIMWSVANEPASNLPEADFYFKTVIFHTKRLDATRPVTFVVNKDYDKDIAAKYTDVQCINRYYGWYQDTGHTEVISYQLSHDLEEWYKKIHKPLIITEYGADTIPGINSLPSFVFTEDYQVDFMREYHNVFDSYKHKFLAGEMVWNFADFMTDQSVKRVDGNKKGILTRQRQPKPSAHLLRDRYWKLINETLPGFKLPVV